MDIAPFIVCLILVLLYVGVLIAWGYNWQKNKLQSGIPLHHFIGCTVALQFIVCILITVYFGNKDPHANGSFATAVLFVFASYIAEAVFFALLILIALGWCILAPHISTRHLVNMLAFVSIYVILLVFNLFDSPYIVYIAISLIVLAMYFGLMYFVFTYIQLHIRRLTKEVREAQEAAPPVETAPNATPMGEFTNFVGDAPPQAYPPQAQGYPPQVQSYPPVHAYPVQGYPGQQVPPQNIPLQASGEQPAQLYPEGQLDTSKETSSPVQTHSPHVIHATAYNPPQAPLSPNTFVIPPPAEPASPAPQRVEVQPTTYTDTQTANRNDNERVPEAQEKLKLYQLFYKLMIFYIILTIVFSFGPSLTGTYGVFTFLRLYLIFFFLCGLCMTFRLRSLNQYFYLVVSDNV